MITPHVSGNAAIFGGDERYGYARLKKYRGLSPRLRLIAMLGGFLARKGDGEPGVKTIWLGLQRVVDFTAVIRFAREAHAL